MSPPCRSLVPPSHHKLHSMLSTHISMGVYIPISLFSMLYLSPAFSLSPFPSSLHLSLHPSLHPSFPKFLAPPLPTSLSPSLPIPLSPYPPLSLSPSLPIPLSPYPALSLSPSLPYPLSLSQLHSPTYKPEADEFQVQDSANGQC